MQKMYPFIEKEKIEKIEKNYLSFIKKYAPFFKISASGRIQIYFLYREKDPLLEYALDAFYKGFYQISWIPLLFFYLLAVYQKEKISKALELLTFQDLNEDIREYFKFLCSFYAKKRDILPPLPLLFKDSALYISHKIALGKMLSRRDFFHAFSLGKERFLKIYKKELFILGSFLLKAYLFKKYYQELLPYSSMYIEKILLLYGSYEKSPKYREDIKSLKELFSSSSYSTSFYTYHDFYERLLQGASPMELKAFSLPSLPFSTSFTRWIEFLKKAIEEDYSYLLEAYPSLAYPYRKHPFSRFYLARAYFFLGKKEKAISLLEDLLEEEGEKLPLLNELFIIYSSLGDWKRAEEYLNLQKKLYPDHPLVEYNMLLLQERKLQEILYKEKVAKNLFEVAGFF